MDPAQPGISMGTRVSAIGHCFGGNVIMSRGPYRMDV